MQVFVKAAIVAVDVANMENNKAKEILEYANVFAQLLAHPRFIEFFETNYDLQRNTDPDTGEQSVAIIERQLDEVQSILLKKIKAQRQAKPKIELVGPEALKIIEDSKKGKKRN